MKFKYAFVCLREAEEDPDFWFNWTGGEWTANLEL